ncbi:ATP-binding protein [Chloroflexota bacterium]
MSAVTQIFEKYTSRRLWVSIPFIIALVVLGFILWNAMRVIVYPHDGIVDVYPTGRIGVLDPSGPSTDKLQVDDVIVSVDGVPWDEALYFDVGKRGGDTVFLVVDRQGASVPIAITLVDPPFVEVLFRLVPLLVALTFWGIGVGVQTFKPAGSAANIFFAWCQVSALLLTAGVASYLGPLWAAVLFNILLWVIGPLSVHFHLYFPQTYPRNLRHFLLVLLYTLAALGSSPFLILGYFEIQALPWYSLYLTTVRLFLAVNLLIVFALLAYRYRHPTYPGTRGKIRIVALGGGLTVIPIVMLTILPDALLHQPFIPYDLTFLLLGLLPITYGYSIYRFHLIEIEAHVNRGATFILVYSILAGFYLVLYAAFQILLPPGVAVSPIINTLLVLVLATFFIPLHGRVKKIVDTIFYGGWYDYRSAVSEMTQGLEQITEFRALAKTISARLVETFRLEETCVFLRDLDGDFSVIEVYPRSGLGNSKMAAYPVLPRTSLTYLLRIGAIERVSLRNALSEVTLTPQELQLLNSEQINLWVPVIGHGLILGLLALGPKLGGDVFSGEDLDILRILARQMSPVIENIHLVTQLRQHTTELEDRVKERTLELHNAKERVEAVLASVGEGVFVTDLEDRVLIVNEAFERQSGYSASDIINRNHLQLLEGYNEPNLILQMQSSLAGGEIWSGELVHQRKGGDPYDIHLTIAPVRDLSAQVVGYVGSQRDITRQKELDRLKDMFVSNVSHELRTPTTNIRLYLELLEDAPPEKSSKYLSVIKEQSQLLTKLVEDILDLSRLAMSRAKKVEFEKIDLNLLAEQVVTAHFPLADATGLNLLFEPCPDLPTILGDQNLMSRVINNLVSNAVRYTPKGNIKVRTYKSDCQIYLSVHDTGIGIESGDLPHIFERFYRGQGVRQSKVHGTGLGLSIVKEIVEQHDGSIEVNSEFGKGSTFKLMLPIKGKA